MKGKVVWDAAEAAGGPGFRQSCNHVKVTGFTMKAVSRSFEQESGQIRFVFLNDLYGF